MSITTAEQLLAPISLDEFRQKYLEKEVLHLERNDPSLVEGMFDVDVLERALRYTRPWKLGSGTLRVIPNKEGSEGEKEQHLSDLLSDTHPDEVVQDNLIEAMAQGATLILNGAHAHTETVSQIVDSLIDALACKVMCNVYCTPAKSQGFDIHADGHDVLVLQTSGRKTWRIYETQDELPMEGSRSAMALFPRLNSTLKKQNENVEQTFVKEVTLSPGDVLYLPRGVPHCAISLDGLSIHYTIGLYPTRRYEYMKELIDLVAYNTVDLRKRVSYDVSMGNETMPSVGEMFRKLADVADGMDEQIDPISALAMTGKEHNVLTLAKGRLEAALLSKQLNLNSKLKPIAGNVSCRVRDKEIEVESGRHSVVLPEKMAAIIPFFDKQHGTFTVGDLPSSLTEQAKLVLARKLVSSGLYGVDEIGDPNKAPSSEAQKKAKETADFMALFDPLAAMPAKQTS